MTNIAFAGLTAAGKTTHAQRLAADLGYDYVSATDILFEILRVPRGTYPWFNQADAISAAREDDAVDAELESRLVDLAPTRDRTVFDSWALAWICPVPVVRIWIESDLPSRIRKCLVSLGSEPRPLGECEAVLRAKDDYNEVRDLDHVVMTDGRIYRVVGNLDHPAKFVGYNVYSPHPGGDRIFRSTSYRKNFTEDDELPQDALDTYVTLPKARICEHLDPHASAAEKAGTFAGSPWADLYAELTALFGPGAVGIFGSAMLGMHLTPNGQVRKDVDFVIEGTGNIPALREHLPAIRSKLGFTEVTSARQGRQYERYRRVFRNPNNSTDLVISRRWTALQAPDGTVTTIRFRTPAVRLPYRLAGAYPV